jgi:hypothetical protein
MGGKGYILKSIRRKCAELRGTSNLLYQEKAEINLFGLKKPVRSFLRRVCASRGEEWALKGWHRIDFQLF